MQTKLVLALALAALGACLGARFAMTNCGRG
jgi:hypothetical protein